MPRSRRREIYNGEKAVGFVGTSARHHELGPIALALVKRNVPTDAQLTVDAMPATQEVVVDPEVGLHVRPKLPLSLVRVLHGGGADAVAGRIGVGGRGVCLYFRRTHDDRGD